MSDSVVWHVLLFSDIPFIVLALKCSVESIDLI